MRRAPFGPTGIDVPLIGQGTWNMERDDEREAIAALRAGIDLGLTHVDTAELYGDGRVERLVRRAIEGRRDELFLVSKVLPQNASYRGTLAACEASLERLGTDRLDLYLLHWRGREPLAETIRAFEDLVAAGKIAAYGVSNFDVADLEEAVGIAGEGRIVCNQVLYHLEERAIEHNVIPWCAQHGVAVVGYSPLGSGSFPSARSKGGKVLGEIGARRGLSPQQVAIAFLLQKGGVFAIPKASKEAHVRANAGVGDVLLDEHELQAIDAAFPAKRRNRLPVI